MVQVFKNLGWFFKAEWKKYLLMAFLLMLLAFLTIIPAQILGDTIDLIALGNIDKVAIVKILLSLLAIPIVRYLLDFSYHYLINFEGQKLAFELRERYLKQMFSLDSKIYEKFTKGDLIARVTNDLDSLTTAATSLLQEIVYQSGVLVFTISAMIISINLKLTLASVIIMPICLTALSIARNKMRKYYKIHRKIYSKMTEKVLESVEGVKVVRAYVAEEKDLVALDEALMNDINSWRKTVRFESFFAPLFELVYWVSYIIAFAYGTYLVINQEISVGSMVTFSVYISSLYGPIIALGNIFNTINNAIVADERYNEIMDLKPDVIDIEHSERIMTFKKIEFIDVSFRYPFDNHDVVHNLTFDINKGETIGIVGKTGSGKSTLIRQLLREFTITSGRILVDGTPIEQFKIKDIRNLVGYVPQSHILFSKTATENIMIGNDHASEKMIQRALKVADFEKDVPYLAKGLETMVGESGNALSGGQKQRLSIARAIIKNPDILILDDSLSAVDGATEKNIIAHLNETRADKTNIIIAHRFSAIKDADKIIVLEEGMITGIGTHDELMASNDWYRSQYLKQTTFGGDDND